MIDYKRALELACRYVDDTRCRCPAEDDQYFDDMPCDTCTADIKEGQAHVCWQLYFLQQAEDRTGDRTDHLRDVTKKVSTEREIAAIEAWIAYYRVGTPPGAWRMLALDALEGQLARLECGYRSSAQVAAKVGIGELVDAPAEAIHAMAVALGVST